MRIVWGLHNMQTRVVEEALLVTIRVFVNGNPEIGTSGTCMVYLVKYDSIAWSQAFSLSPLSTQEYELFT